MKLPIEYYESQFRARYYTWKAQRGMSMTGNCPMTGKPRKAIISSYRDKEESLIVNKTLAKFWLEETRKIRQRCLDNKELYGIS